MPVTSQAGTRKFLAWGKTKFNATFIDEDTLPVQQGTCSLASIQCCVCCISVFSCLLLCCSIHQRWATNPFMMLMFAALELIVHTDITQDITNLDRLTQIPEFLWEEGNNRDRQLLNAWPSAITSSKYFLQTRGLIRPAFSEARIPSALTSTRLVWQLAKTIPHTWSVDGASILFARGMIHWHGMKKPSCREFPRSQSLAHTC